MKLIIGILVILGVIAGAASLVLVCSKAWRTRVRRMFGRSSPASAPAPDQVGRIVETVVLACIGVVAFAVPIANDGIPVFVRLPPVLFLAVVLIVVLAIVGFVVALVIALFWRTAAGSVIMGVVLAAYLALLGNPRVIVERFPGADLPLPLAELVFNIHAFDADSAELWINDVYVGKTPLVMTREEFNAKVSTWPGPPEAVQTLRETEKETSQRGPIGSSAERLRREAEQWIRIRPPHRPEAHYYARIQVKGSWVKGVIHTFTRRQIARHVERRNWYFSPPDPRKRAVTLSGRRVILPRTDPRLGLLLDKARLAEYRVDANWFKAMETHGDGSTLRGPEMMQVLDAWATWRYGLGDVDDDKSAWEAFERVCE